MNHEELIAALEADGWTRDGDELQRDGSAVLLHSDGQRVAVAHSATYPIALATDPANALAWARNSEDFDRAACVEVRLA